MELALAMQLRQWEAEETAELCGHHYPFTAQQTWDRAGDYLHDAYRADARRIIRFLDRYRRPRPGARAADASPDQPDPTDLPDATRST